MIVTGGSRGIGAATARLAGERGYAVCVNYRRDAEAAAQTLFSGDIAGMSVSQLLQVFPNVPSATTAFASDGWPIVELLASSRVTPSKGEATRLIRSGGIYVNNRRITDEKLRLRPEDAVEGELFVVRKGKRDNFLIRIVRS